MAEVLLVITIIVEIGAALMIIVGYKARLGALALLLWMIPVTLIFHAFWAVPADQVQMQMINFFKNLGLMGAMLLIIGFGPGAYSVDRR
ncbi:MAG: DoxX family membrane protein, partial [Gammaproteobacteria bacterium]